MLFSHPLPALLCLASKAWHGLSYASEHRAEEPPQPKGGNTLRQSLTEQRRQLVRPGGSLTFAVALRGALSSLCSFANETAWAAQHPPVRSTSSPQAETLLLPLPPQQGSGGTCGYWQTLSLLPFLPPPLWNKHQGEKKQVFLCSLSQINPNVDGWVQTLSLWDSDVFLGSIIWSYNPWKKNQHWCLPISFHICKTGHKII